MVQWLMNGVTDKITDAVKELFNGMLSGFLTDLIEEAFDMLDELLVDLLDIVLNCQEYMVSHIGLTGIDFDKINMVILEFSMAVILLKFLSKGFNIYILQNDGDADHDPFQLLIGLFEAMAISLTFYGLYPYLVQIFKSFTNKLLKAIGNKGEISTVTAALLKQQGVVTIILIVVLAVILFILYIKLIMDGAELMILRYGMPFLSVGLMDSDGGTFKAGGKKFLQMGFTCTLRIVLLRFSIALVLTLHPIWGIAFAILSLAVPKLLQEYLFMKQGSGFSSKIYAASAIRNFIK